VFPNIEGDIARDGQDRLKQMPSGLDHAGQIVCRRRKPVGFAESALNRKIGQNGIIADHRRHWLAIRLSRFGRRKTSCMRR
jgi:hypothetical protein